ncbi:hypothetical protein MPSEU_000463900 [Mayamaea pseudoterrestris]|nr:hypothetical protein MPSEU_000463900 [Mayamaea pseudoterrestris]
MKPVFQYVVLLLFILIQIASAGIPRKASYFPQLVDHDDENDHRLWSLWSQRFYSLGEHFKGPGSPIFLILGGEGAIEPSTGILYPFIANDLAVSFNAFILQPEHRFYGESQPISKEEITRARANGLPDPRIKLLSPDQAIRDALRLLQFVSNRLGCSSDRFSSKYCPVIAVGGSYPAFLAAMARTAYPHMVDMAYAASPPMKFYAQTIETGDEYYEHITEQTEQAFPGCAQAVQTTLQGAVERLVELQTLDETLFGACGNTLPAYINSTQTLVDEIVMMVGYTFANFNMAYYPPSNKTQMAHSCQTFMNEQVTDPLSRLENFFRYAFTKNNNATCFDMSQQLPTGEYATISAGDWSGVGAGSSGESWDFQTCTRCVERINMAGFLPKRNWSMDWLNEHCQRRFNVHPTPYELVEKWHFDDLVAAGASHILFTNGLVDGWSVAGIKSNLSDTQVAINFENGAHHSDLSYYKGLHDDATDDVKQGRTRIRALLAQWLHELPGGSVVYKN